MEAFLASIGIKGVIAGVVGVFGYVIAFLQANHDDIKAIILRVEKDAEDGWSNTEKEDLAVSLFFQYGYTKLPFYVKMIPNAWIEGIVRKVIKGLCAKSHELAGKIAEIKK